MKADRITLNAARAFILELLIAIPVTALVIAPLTLVFGVGANWDEFNFLSKVHLAQDGTLEGSRQAFHVYLFAWVPEMSSHALDQIVAARMGIWILFASSLFFLYCIARQFQSRVAALFSILCLVGFSFVIEHGTSFRYDPIAIFLVLGAAWLYLRPGRYSAAGAGIALACALLVTIKSAILFPALTGLWLWRGLQNGSEGAWSEEVKRGIILALSAILTVATFVLLHGNGEHGSSSEPVSKFLGRSFHDMLLEPGFLPRLEYLLIAVRENPVFFIFFLTGFFVLIARLIWLSGRARMESLALFLLGLPILTLLVYRNAYPYFYWFILPFPALFCGIALDSLTGIRSPGPYIDRSRRISLTFATLVATMLIQIFQSPYFWFPLLALPIILLEPLLGRMQPSTRRRLARTVLIISCIVITASAVTTIRMQADRSHQTQRRVLDAVYEIFPKPVAYIDRCSMVPQYPKTGFFMSSWGMDRYHGAGTPLMRSLIIEHQPRFLLVNHPALNPETSWVYPVGLFPEDKETLRQNFVHHWGPIWVPGKIVDPAGASRVFVEILNAGQYILDSETPVLINGAMTPPGSEIRLDQGSSLIEWPGKPDVLKLQLDIPVPAAPEPAAPLFAGFGRE